MIIKEIVAEHADEAPFLWLLRATAVHAPHYDLDDLAQLDERIEAHLDGLRVGGAAGWEFVAAQLDMEEAGEVFVAAVLALESKDPDRLDRVLAVAKAVPETTCGMISALGWVTPQQLKGTGKTFLNGGSPFMKRLGIAACALHRVDPGPLLDRALESDDGPLVARALRAAAELGRQDLVPVIEPKLKQEDDAVRFWAAWAAVRLGARGRELESLRLTAMGDSPFAARALQFVPRVLSGAESQAWFKALVGDPSRLRDVITAIGVRGDPHYLPWLIKQMEVSEVARLAGEAFTLVTGVDLAHEQLESVQPLRPDMVDDDDLDAIDITMDPDEDLPWPEPRLIQAWWNGNKGRFEAGQRYLLGQAISEAQCEAVLRSGYQRQRRAAALELALMKPDRPLFETRARGQRQEQLLGIK